MELDELDLILLYDKEKKFRTEIKGNAGKKIPTFPLKIGQEKRKGVC